MKKHLLLAALTLALGACATAPNTSEADAAIAAAEKEIAAAKKTGYLWRDTEKFLEDAKKAKTEGNIEAAVKSANKALNEAKLAQVQAKDNANPKAQF